MLLYRSPRDETLRDAAIGKLAPWFWWGWEERGQPRYDVCGWDHLELRYVEEMRWLETEGPCLKGVLEVVQGGGF